MPSANSENIHTAFEENKVPTDLVVFDEAGHGFGKEDAAKAMTEMVRWFQMHVGEK